MAVVSKKDGHIIALISMQGLGHQIVFIYQYFKCNVENAVGIFLPVSKKCIIFSAIQKKEKFPVKLKVDLTEHSYYRVLGQKKSNIK